MGADGNRRRVLVLALLGVLCALVYVVGVLGDGRRPVWKPPASSAAPAFPPAGELTGDDLTVVQGDCDPGVSPMQVRGACVFEVEERSGLASVREPVRRSTLSVATGPVQVVAVVEGQEITTNVGAGKSVRLTVGTGGGRLALVCLAVVPGDCTVVLVGGAR